MVLLPLQTDGIGDLVRLSGALPIIIRENLRFGFKHGGSQGIKAAFFHHKKCR
jgi:hypothetical protein